MSVISKILENHRGWAYANQPTRTTGVPFSIPTQNSDVNDWTFDFYKFIKTTPIKTYYISTNSFAYQGTCYVCRIILWKRRTGIFDRATPVQQFRNTLFLNFYNELSAIIHNKSFVLHRVEDIYDADSDVFRTIVKGVIV